VKDWLHFLPLPLAAWHADHVAQAGAIAAWACGLAYTSAINQAFDDRLDAPAKNPVAAMGRRRAISLSIPPAIACVVLLAWLSRAGLAAGAVMIVAATLYSAPPRLKRLPVVGTLWNLVMGVPGLFFAGRPQIDALPLRPLAGLFALLLLVSQLLHEAHDRDDDAAGRVRTVATEAGRRAALGAALGLVLLTPAVAWWLGTGAARRMEAAALCAAFALAWGGLLAARLGCENLEELRRLRLQYRWSAMAVGAAVFLALYS
jgi:UbiA prenyltransferase family